MSATPPPLPPDPIAVIAEHLGAIRAVLEAGHESSEKTRAEARASLEAQRVARETKASEKATATAATAVDWFPFLSMPAGTKVRDLPSGGRLFALADGVFVRVNARGEIVVVTDSGEVALVAPARGGQVWLPGGRELAVQPAALRVTHEAAGIEGLPASVEPILVAEGRYSLTLPNGTRLDIGKRDQLATVVTRIGTVVVLGFSRIDAVGESVQVRSIPGGVKSFLSTESGVKGIVDSDGSIHVTMPGGEDLVIRFPATSGPELPTLPTEPFTFCSERRS